MYIIVYQVIAISSTPIYLWVRWNEGWRGKRLRDYVLTPFDDPSTFVKKGF